MRQYEHFAKRRVEIKAFLSWWRLLHVIAHPSDDIPGSVRVPDNTIEASLASPTFGGSISRKRIPARALLRAVAIGCKISWESEAANSPIVPTRFMWVKFRLDFASGVLSLLALCHIYSGTDKLDELAVFVENRMTRGADVPNCSVSQ